MLWEAELAVRFAISTPGPFLVAFMPSLRGIFLTCIKNKAGKLYEISFSWFLKKAAAHIWSDLK